jgi:pimeloyl-ACP methyl ester carboxylesterase
MDKELLALTCPAYIISAEDDPLTPVKAGEIIQRSLKHANRDVFPAGKGGHDFLRNDVQAHTAVRTWLQKCVLPQAQENTAKL